MRLFPVLITLLVALAFLAPDVIANRKVVVEIYDGPDCESSKLIGKKAQEFSFDPKKFTNCVTTLDSGKTEIRSINPFVTKNGGVAGFNTTTGCLRCLSDGSAIVFDKVCRQGLLDAVAHATSYDTGCSSTLGGSFKVTDLGLGDGRPTDAAGGNKGIESSAAAKAGKSASAAMEAAKTASSANGVAAVLATTVFAAIVAMC